VGAAPATTAVGCTLHAVPASGTRCDFPATTMPLLRTLALAASIAVAVASVALAETPRGDASTNAPPVELRETPAGVRYALRAPAEGQRPAPVLLVFATDAQRSLAEPYDGAGRALAEHGWLCVALDAPCHGADSRPGEPPQLEGWRARVAAGEPLLTEFCARASAVLDLLADEGLADPRRVAACGTSRGGFLALHFAAAEPRVGAVAAIAPVTELGALREFAGLEDDPAVAALDVAAQAQALAGRPVWITIGNRDARVGTDRAIRLARRLVEAAPADAAIAPVELHVTATEGHRADPRAYQDAATWIAARLAAAGE
jgi:dienelactone hydrolase